VRRQWTARRGVPVLVRGATGNRGGRTLVGRDPLSHPRPGARGGRRGVPGAGRLVGRLAVPFGPDPSVPAGPHLGEPPGSHVLPSADEPRPGGAGEGPCIASRTPGYAFLILLPILDAGALGLLTYATPAQNPAAASLALGAVTTAALLATFFGPAFFAIEVVAYSYGRSLPLSNQSTILGKVALISLMYLVAATLIVGFTLLRFFQPFTFVAFVLAELPAVLGAAFFELGLLFRWARRRGLAITNLYAGAWFALVVSIPGLIMAGLPPLLFDLTRSRGTDLGLGIMALVAVAELALAAPVAF